MSKGKVTEARISDLVPDDRNFNRGTEYGNALLEKSFQQFGAGRSILLDRNNRIIAGNKAAGKYGELGGEKVIVVETDGDTLVAVKRTDVDLDSRTGRELALADNATQRADLEWDSQVLGEVSEQWGIDAAAWGVEAGESLARTEATEDYFDPDTDATETRCRKGDLWQLGEHLLMCGDSSLSEDVQRLMQGEKADMVFTDPPYGVSIGDKNKMLNTVQKAGRCCENIENDTLPPEELYKLLVSAMTNCRENCKDDASYFVTAPQGGELGLMMMMRDAGLPVRHNLIWKKNAPTFSMGRLDYDYEHEPIMYTWTKSHHNYRGGKFRSTVWEYDRPRKCDLHPTMKPVELVANCLSDCTKSGQIALDLFGGSGTTIIAAEQLGRKARVMELDPHYCDVIIARWEKFTGKTATKIE